MRIQIALVLSLTLACLVAAGQSARAQEMRSDAAVDRSIVNLGMHLFADKRLSSTRNVSCATCHVPSKAFSDGLPVAVGAKGQLGTRNTPSLWNVANMPNQFWDGRRGTLEEQALDPLLNPREHGIADQAALVAIVREDVTYRAEFQSAFRIRGEQISAAHIAKALAAFERTLISDSSAFDRYYYHNEKDALSASAIRGLDLFVGRARCASCHTFDRTSAQFTDHRFHSLGIGLEPVMPRLAELTQALAAADPSTLNRLISEDASVAALGRFVLTKDPRDIGKFRTPSLRNVGLTAPYMHDGSVATLEAAIDSEIYYRSLEANRPLILTPSDKADLIAFLTTLTSSNARSFPTNFGRAEHNHD